MALSKAEKDGTGASDSLLLGLVRMLSSLALIFQWIFVDGVEWKLLFCISLSTIYDFHYNPSTNIHWNNFADFSISVGTQAAVVFAGSHGGL